MKDIIERLDDCRAIDGSVNFVEINENILTDAIAEITRLRATIDQLRSVAGAVSIESGLTFAGIKQGLPQVQKSDVMLKSNG